MAVINGFLRLEDGSSYLLLEDGSSRLIFEQRITELPSPEAITNIPVITIERRITITYSDPLHKTTRLKESELKNFEKYGHEIKAIGGYTKAKFKIQGGDEEVADWIENGLARFIRTYSPEGEIIWEGIVNKITVNYGPRKFSLGPLTDIVTQASVEYSEADYTVDPPVFGSRASTGFASNSAAVTKYGIIQDIVGLDGSNLTAATQHRNTFLLDPNNVSPKKTGNSSILTGSSLEISVDLIGLWEWLSLYRYSKSSTLEQNLSQKIIDVLTAEPNGTIFSTDYNKITSNTTQVEVADNDNRKAQNILVALNKLGDSSYNRYNMGFYKNRRFVYEQAPSTLEYLQYVKSNPSILDLRETIIEPWNILPGKWMLNLDFIPGKDLPTTFAKLTVDVRASYIETAKFDTPYNATVDGFKLSEWDVFLARRGIGDSG